MTSFKERNTSKFQLLMFSVVQHVDLHETDIQVYKLLKYQNIQVKILYLFIKNMVVHTKHNFHMLVFQLQLVNKSHHWSALYLNKSSKCWQIMTVKRKKYEEMKPCFKFVVTHYFVKYEVEQFCCVCNISYSMQHSFLTVI